VGHFRRRLTYANVMATIAVFAALGGGAYAAAKITGRDVVNRSLTGKDIKKRSVPLNRLKRRLAPGRRGAEGPQGPKGDPGPAGPVDPSRFLPADGVTTAAVGPTEWTPTSSSSLARTALEANRVEFSVGGASAIEFLALEPTVPVTLAGRPVRLLAATLCVHTMHPAATLQAVFIGHYRSPPSNGFGGSAQVTQFSDLTSRKESACRRYVPQEPFVLLPNDYVNVRLRFAFTGAASIYVGASSFELAPA
jgi:hypothetical protein